MSPVTCSRCSAGNPSSAQYCNRCGHSFYRPPIERQTISTEARRFLTWLTSGLLGLIGLLIAVTIITHMYLGDRQSNITSKSNLASASPPMSPSPSSTFTPEEMKRINRKAEAINKRQAEANERLNSTGGDLAKFVAFVRSVDRQGDIIHDIQPGSSPGHVRIVVTNQWHYEPYQMRLQTAQKMWQAWAGFHSPAEPDKARIRIVDLNGNEVGGSRILGGSLIWVKE